MSQCKWNYRIDRVRLEMIGESPEKEFVKHAALLNIQIILNLTIAPVREILGMIINLLDVNGCLMKLR